MTGNTEWDFSKKEFKKGVFVIYAVNRYNQLSSPVHVVKGLKIPSFSFLPWNYFYSGIFYLYIIKKDLTSDIIQ
ncbi:MAG: hypothetical protein U5K51_09175 [Flavobacteriaceae bacterium]|nr:hypothetical protein [Flavobacteriaceae bacterium]